MNETPKIRLTPRNANREPYLDLLLLADDSEQEVLCYYRDGDLYVCEVAAGETIGIALVVPHHDAFELKSVAIAPERQGQGIGQQMLAFVIDDLRRRGVARVIVGTGNSSIGQIAFYQKAGFRLWRIERDFFSPERGYPEGLSENGIALRDMVWFDRLLA